MKAEQRKTVTKERGVSVKQGRCQKKWHIRNIFLPITVSRVLFMCKKNILNVKQHFNSTYKTMEGIEGFAWLK